MSMDLLSIKYTAIILTLSHLSGGFRPPWETFLNNSKTAQAIEMEFFKFNLKPMG